MLVVPTRFTLALSPDLAARQASHADLFIPPRRDDGDESLVDLSGAAGREALEKIAEPLMAGIHVADAERLVCRLLRFIQLSRNMAIKACWLSPPRAEGLYGSPLG
jgi:oxygen-dependent protoporphyrinogen oxidase